MSETRPPPKWRGPITLLWESREFRCWSVVVVAMCAVLYVVSVGRAIGSYHRNPTHEAYATVVNRYRPFLIIVGRSPSGVRWTVEQIVRFWLPSDRNFGIHTDDSANFGIWPVEFE